MIIIVFSLVALALLAVVVRRQRNARAASATLLDESPISEPEIKANIRRDVAPESRPYAAGQFGADGRGRCYVVGTDGAVRRVAIVGTEDGPAILSVRKLAKSERKARKRQIRAARATATH